jgi:carboxyl-terminal processing protease
MRKTLFLLGALVGAGLTVLVTQPGVMSVGLSAVAASSDTYQELNLFGDVFDRVRVHYVEKPGDRRLIESAIDGMLRELDPILATSTRPALTRCRGKTAVNSSALASK